MDKKLKLVYFHIVVLCSIITLSSKTKLLQLNKYMYHISRFPKQKRKGIQKNRTILYGLYVRGKIDQGIEVPYGPIGKKTIYNVLFTRYLNLLNRKKTLSVFIPHGIITYYG